MALITGGVSGVNAEVGATSKGLYTEPVASDGKLPGATKTMFQLVGINITPTTSDAMATLVPVRNGVAAASGTTFAVTSGKRLVILGWSIVTRNAGAAVQGVRAALRVNPSGNTVIGSQALVVIGAGTAAATTNVVGSQAVQISGPWPAYIEFPDSWTFGVSVIGTNTAGCDISIWGFEY